MNTVKILNTTISETSLVEVSNILNTENSLKVAICNTNTVVRSYRDDQLSNIINSFDIKTPDGFPIAKSSSILYKNSQSRVMDIMFCSQQLMMGLVEIPVITFMEVKILSEKIRLKT